MYYIECDNDKCGIENKEPTEKTHSIFRPYVRKCVFVHFGENDSVIKGFVTYS